MPSKAHRSKEACRRWASLLVYIYIHIFIFIIQVHCLTCTLGLLSHVAPCIMTEDGLKCVKSIVLMIESLLPQLLDGSANINIPACLIQYHYSLLLISYSLSETHSSIVHCLQILSSLFTPFHLPVSILSAALPPPSIANILLSLLHFTSMHLSLLP